jgi:hypothetical protein
MAILNLGSHPFVWVTVRELADYWRVSAGCVIEQIAAGGLDAIQIRPGIFRVRTDAAIEFEQRGRVTAATRWPAVLYAPRSVNDNTIGVAPGRPRAPSEMTGRRADE